MMSGVGRFRDELSRRFRRLLRTGVPIVQCAVAAGLAWFLAHEVVGHITPFFAPVAAVVSLGVSLGQRMRRALELVVGVSIGVGVGDLLIAYIGSGSWQITLVVALAMSTAVIENFRRFTALSSRTSSTALTLRRRGSWRAMVFSRHSQM